MREKYDTFDICKKMNREWFSNDGGNLKIIRNDRFSIDSDATCKANDKSVIN